MIAVESEGISFYILDVEFGSQACYFNETFFESTNDANHTKEEDFCTKGINETKLNETICRSTEYCYWDYSGGGIEYQVLANL